ncbi:FG-GAP repeat domain-containing protein [Alteromonas aestuariivivens]|nr:VCBS repeat-containing protein [Alteromonas aestuariivivens]
MEQRFTKIEILTLWILLTCLFMAWQSRAQFVFDETTLNVPGEPFAVITGDFNGDGAPDIAASIYYFGFFEDGRSVVVYLNDGIGGFLPGVEYPTGLSPAAIDVADIDDDGDLDMAVSNAESDTVTVLINDGIGQFNSSRTYGLAGGENARDIKFLDWDRDGHEDIFVINNLGSVYLTLLVNNGSGDFTRITPVPIGRFSVAGAPADFDADGATDLAISSLGEDTVHVLLSDGDGWYWEHIEIDALDNPFQLTAEDFNLDGTPDLVVTREDGLAFYRNDGAANFQFARLYRFIEDRPLDIQLVDLNNDGIKDYAAAVGYEDSGVAVLLSNSLGRPAERIDFSTEPNPGDVSSVESIASADFDGDGVKDLIVNDSATDMVRVFYNRTAASPLLGAVTGITTSRVRCKNITTRQSVQLLGPHSNWNCSAAGLVTHPGDRVAILIDGEVTDAAVAGASTQGISDKRRVSCTAAANVARNYTMKASWNCEEMGVPVAVGDSVHLIASGIVY